MRTLSKFKCLFVVCLVLTACVANVGLVPPEQMKPKELATYAMGVYNSQYDSYMQKATLPNLSDTEKQVLRVKKSWLDGAWPIIQTFNWYIGQGQLPPADLQPHVLNLLDTVRY